MPKTCSFLALSEANQLALLSELEYLLTITGISPSLIPKKCGSHWSQVQIDGPTRLSPSTAGSICDFFSQSAWVVGSHRSIHTTSWVEIVADFIFQFGYFPGFTNQSMTLKVLVQRFKRAAMRLFQFHQLSINALRSTHLLSFGFCHVASRNISRSFRFHLRFLGRVCLQTCCKKIIRSILYHLTMSSLIGDA